MIITGEFHTHTTYSDGKSSMEEMVLQAQSLNYKTIAITDHGYRHLAYGVRYRDYPKMREEIKALQEKYTSMEILLGVEANILDQHGQIDVDDRILSYVDFVIAGYHFGSYPTSWRGSLNHLRNYIKPFNKMEIDYNTQSLIQAMKQNDLFILTHPGDKGMVHTREVAKAALKTNTILEINEHHQHLNTTQLQEIKDLDLKFVLSSDAHHPRHLGQFSRSISAIRASGIKESQIINALPQNR